MQSSTTNVFKENTETTTPPWPCLKGTHIEKIKCFICAILHIETV